MNVSSRPKADIENSGLNVRLRPKADTQHNHRALAPGKQLSAEEVIAFCKQHLAAYKYPRLVEFRDSLPKGPTGKILKRELR